MGKLGQSCALVCLALAGCATTTPSTELAELRHRLDEQARRAALAEHRIDELENRVFLLTDQVESQKVAALHRESRSLPVVRLRPEPDAPPPAAVADTAAARPEDDGARPTLRIDGTRIASAAHTTSKTIARPDQELPDVGDDNLDVAPAPPIRARETPPAASDAAPATLSLRDGTPSERSAPAREPIALYRQSYEELRAGRHEEAARGFREFVRRYPRHDYADNAQYWLGECYYDQKRYEEAAPQFRAVVSRWPTGNKAPDALLKLGFTLLALGRTSEARATLREVPATYPHTEAARLATERLSSLSPTEGTK